MLIDGRALAQTILDSLKLRVDKLIDNQIPHLAIIKVGNDPATNSYIRQKESMGKKIGALVSTYNCSEKVSEKELLETISFLQKKGDIHGLIIQLPLPTHLNEEKLLNQVDVNLDVDGFRGDSDFPMPIASAVMRILEEIHTLDQGKKDFQKELSEFKHWLKAQKIVILGKGKTGGKPIINALIKMHINPEVIDSKTQNPREVIKKADILICAVGNHGTIVTEDMIKKDAILIGIGMSLGPDGKLHGDYEIEDIQEKASYYTPIPGGVGPVNAAMLFMNVVQSAEKSAS